MKKPFLIISVLLFSIAFSCCNTPDKTETRAIQDQPKEHYTFRLSEQVTRTKVSFKNRYGFRVVGDLYLPKSPDEIPLAAIAIAGPTGAVKEQASGLYANSLAERGFAALAFDPSYSGESEGNPRSKANPIHYTEDFSAAIDFLSVQPQIDPDKLGLIGICGFGAIALNVTSVDQRIKAVVAISMNDYQPNEEYLSAEMNPTQRPLDILPVNHQSTAKATPPQSILQEFQAYFKTKRGFHPRSEHSNGTRKTGSLSPFLNPMLRSNIAAIYPRQILLVAGSNAHSLLLSQTAFEAAKGQRELLIIQDALHTDLYDGGDRDYIPFNNLEVFFKNYLQ